MGKKLEQKGEWGVYKENPSFGAFKQGYVIAPSLSHHLAHKNLITRGHEEVMLQDLCWNGEWVLPWPVTTFLLTMSGMLPNNSFIHSWIFVT